MTNPEPAPFEHVPHYYPEWLDWWTKRPLEEVVREVQRISWFGPFTVRHKAAVKDLARRVGQML